MSKVDNTFLTMKKPKDPYDFINKKTQKIEINPGVPYRSTSHDEVFEPRIYERNAAKITNPFLNLPPEIAEPDEDKFDNDEY